MLDYYCYYYRGNKQCRPILSQSDAKNSVSRITTGKCRLCCSFGKLVKISVICQLLIFCKEMNRQWGDCWDDTYLYRPCSPISQCTDCMTFNLLAQLPQHVNLLRTSFANRWHSNPHIYSYLYVFLQTIIIWWTNHVIRWQSYKKTRALELLKSDLRQYLPLSDRKPTDLMIMGQRTLLTSGHGWRNMSTQMGHIVSFVRSEKDWSLLWHISSFITSLKLNKRMQYAFLDWA